MRYPLGEARPWARENLRGVCGCLLPTLRSDMKGLNEAAVRHDVRHQNELGFAGALLVSECGTTSEEYRDFIGIVRDEAPEDFLLIVQAAEPTLEQNISLVQYAERAGVDLVLPSYPLTFYPTSEDEVVDYTKALTDATGLGTILFAAGHWNFGRLHPSNFSPALIRSILDQCPNVAAIKAENGGPGAAGISEIFERFRDEVVVCEPLEFNAPVWSRAYGMPFMGTSNYEYFGDAIPRMHALLQDPGSYDDAMELFWSIQPARAAYAQLQSGFSGGGLVHRLVWKYQGWLNGFNGGPIRSPHLRLSDRAMRQLRDGHARSGKVAAPGDDRDFFTGRLPE